MVVTGSLNTTTHKVPHFGLCSKQHLGSREGAKARRRSPLPGLPPLSHEGKGFALSSRLRVRYSLCDT
jgi:hypothetical protein